MNKLFRIASLAIMMLQITLSGTPYLPEMDIFGSDSVPVTQAADLNDPTCEVNNECNYI